MVRLSHVFASCLVGLRLSHVFASCLVGLRRSLVSITTLGRIVAMEGALPVGQIGRIILLLDIAQVA